MTSKKRTVWNFFDRIQGDKVVWIIVLMLILISIVCLGVDNTKIHAAFAGIVGEERICDTLSADEAVQAASRFASPGDVVLLSPCCASFDLFGNYEDRGRKFKNAVRKL